MIVVVLLQETSWTSCKYKTFEVRKVSCSAIVDPQNVTQKHKYFLLVVYHSSFEFLHHLLLADTYIPLICIRETN
jgi:hypothetical protein